MLRVTMLGTGGMLPLRDRALASAMLSVNGHNLLIDCGEGTQIQIRENRLGFKAIDAILITHFHGDHVSGLPGLLLSMGNHGRTESVVIAGPVGLAHVVDNLRVIAPGLPFEIRYRELNPVSPAPFHCGGMQIEAFPLKHSVPCLGYHLELKRAGRFLPERARETGVPMALWSVLQKQPRAELDGVIYTQDMVLDLPRRGISVIYATDTRPTEALVRAAQDCDLLIAEGMYGDPAKASRARESGHMLMEEAAAIAARSNARRLWLTHYSPSMTDPYIWLERVRAIYPEAAVARDGMEIDLPYPE